MIKLVKKEKTIKKLKVDHESYTKKYTVDLKMKDYKKNLNNTPDNISNSDNEKSLQEELDKKNNEIIEINKELNLFKDKLERCENRLLNVINEKKELWHENQKYEFMELDLKLQNFDNLKGKIFKAIHRVDVTEKLLDESKKDVEALKIIINDYENLSFLDFIRNKKPNSLIKYIEDNNIDEKEK